MLKIILLSLTLIFSLGVLIDFSFAEEYEYEIEIETIAENLNIPWAIDFAPDGRIFFTERSGGETTGTTREGAVRIIDKDGTLLDEPALTLTVERREGGVLGLILDPNFEENHFVYVYYTKKFAPFPKDFLADVKNRLSRFEEIDNKLQNEYVLIDNIPGSHTHDGGRIKFGPDGKLYATTGEIYNSELSQDLNSLGGKILRINPDGSIPDDNPFENSPVYSYGHRNPQGISWDSQGNLISSEHGPSGENGWEGRDEINVIISGQNYGWPNISGDMIDEKYVSPIYQTGQEMTWAPSGIVFYNSDYFSEWKGKLFVANLYAKDLRILDLDIEQNKVISNEVFLKNEFGRLRDVVEGPDGSLYLLTSNTDGRGIPKATDDRILKITPLSAKEILSNDYSLSPLKQIHNGVLPKNILCKPGLELLIKKSSGMPACVTSQTAAKLIEHNWGIYP